MIVKTHELFLVYSIALYQKQGVKLYYFDEQIKQKVHLCQRHFEQQISVWLRWHSIFGVFYVKKATLGRK